MVTSATKVPFFVVVVDFGRGDTVKVTSSVMTVESGGAVVSPSL